jgi:acetyl-CoA carboxylase alpha subunit
MKMLLFVFIFLFQKSTDQRVLDIYAKSKSDKNYLAQTKIFASDLKGLKIRDLVIKEHFGAATFKITLTGKDGGIKLTSKSVLTLEKLYNTIDAMPMRKAEMMRLP